jgi:DNA mismatch repair protein MutL
MSNSRPRIQILPAPVAEKIAAGEIIERPASVVKELVENSLDAGASEIAVLLENGGKALIEVIDNGHGMGADDLSICSERHATSKLRSVDDLERVNTLGFRGEALPSIAAVSELSIISRSTEESLSSTASEIVITNTGDSHAQSEPQTVTFGHFLGSPHGTRIRSQGLFSQVPARLKFLKSQAAEVSQVREWMERLALTHPHVGFSLLSDDRTILNLRPQEEPDRVRALLADDKDYPMISAKSEPDLFANSGLRLRAHWLQGLSTPQTKKLIQAVNRRAVRDRVLQQALLTPFRQVLMPGQFPAVALFVEIDPAAIDVNVHPTKTEIRFLESSKVFRAVESLISSLIEQHGAPAYASSLMAHAPTSTSETWQATQAWDFSTPSFSIQPTDVLNSKTQALATQISATSSPHPLQSARFAGSLFNTYLLYDLGEELALIDQHAAHERIRYEALRKRVLSPSDTLSSQALLLPEVAHFQPEFRPLLESRLFWLEALGFEAEIFGDDAVVFRAVPGEWGQESLRTRLKNLVERVISIEHTERAACVILDESLFEALASEACHSAVRAGDHIEPIEAATLLEELFKCEHPWNCPHGRPTVVRVPRSRFEEWFQRRL